MVAEVSEDDEVTGTEELVTVRDARGWSNDSDRGSLSSESLNPERRAGMRVRGRAGVRRGGGGGRKRGRGGDKSRSAWRPLQSCCWTDRRPRRIQKCFTE